MHRENGTGTMQRSLHPPNHDCVAGTIESRRSQPNAPLVFMEVHRYGSGRGFSSAGTLTSKEVAGAQSQANCALLVSPLTDHDLMPADELEYPEDEDADAHISDGQGEEAPDVPRLRDPGEPTQNEIDLHAQTGHANFRSWCPHCVRGRARDGPHHPTRRAADAIAVISFDYCFFKASAEAESEGSPILVMHDDVSKGVYAHVILQKGIQYPLVDLVIQAVVRDIHSLGYRRVIINDD